MRECFIPANQTKRTGGSGSAQSAAPEKAPKKKRFHQRKGGAGLKLDLSADLVRILGVDLTQVPGINALGVLIILSEIGLDMSRWRDSKAFSSWLGLCPGSKISGGKVLNSRTPDVVNRVATS